MNNKDAVLALYAKGFKVQEIANALGLAYPFCYNLVRNSVEKDEVTIPGFLYRLLLEYVRYDEKLCDREDWYEIGSALNEIEGGREFIDSQYHPSFSMETHCCECDVERPLPNDCTGYSDTNLAGDIDLWYCEKCWRGHYD